MATLWKVLSPPASRPLWVRVVGGVLASLILLALEAVWPASWGRISYPAFWLPVVAICAWAGGASAAVVPFVIGLGNQIAAFPGPEAGIYRTEFIVRFCLYIPIGLAICALGGALHHFAMLWRTSRHMGRLEFSEPAQDGPGFVWSTQNDGSEDFVNRAWTGFIGVQGGESRNRFDYIHPDDRERVRTAMDLARETLTPYHIEYRLKRHDGEYRWILEHAVPRSSGNDKFEGFIGLGTDVTAAHQERDELVFIAKLQNALASSLDLDKTADEVCKALVPAVADWCSLHTIRESDGLVEPLKIYHTDPERVAEVMQFDHTSPLAGAQTAGYIKIAREGQPHLVQRVDEAFARGTATSPQVLDFIRKLGLVSYLGVPLRVRGRVVGVMSISTAESKRVLNEETLHLMEKVAGIAAFAIENARLYRSARTALAAEEFSRRRLEHTERQFRSAWEADIFGMCIVERDGSIRSANNAFVRLTGAPVSDLETGRIRLRSRIDNREVTFGGFVWERIHSAERCEPFEKTCIRPDGEEVPVLVAASMHPDQKSCIVFVLDLKERKAFEAELESQRALLNTIINAVPAMVGYVGRDHRLTVHNRRYEEWLGVSGSELREVPVDSLPGHGRTPEETDAFRRAFAGEAASYETRFDTSGRERLAMVSLRPNVSGTGEVSGVVVHAYDITEARLLAAAVARSEKRYRTLVTASAAIVWAADTEGTVRDVYGWETFTGRRIGQDKNGDWMDATHPDDRELLGAQWSKVVKSAKPTDMYYRLRGADGRYRHVHARSAPLINADGVVEEWIGYVSDITQRVEAEQLLRRKEAELKLVVDTMPALVSYVDNRHRYVFVNQAYEKWFGVDPQTMRGRDIADFLGEKAYERVRPHLNKALSGESVRYEEYLPYEKGPPRWISATLTPHTGERGEVLGYFALIIDITDQKAAEKERAELLERYRFLADAMPQSVWTANAEGVQDYFNNRWIEYTGVTVDRDPNHWPEFIHPDDMAETRRRWLEAVATGDRYRMEHRLRDRNGNYHWFLSLAVARRDESGKVVQWVGSATNIDPQRKAYAGLAEARAELRRHADTLEQLVRQRTARLEEVNAELEAFTYSVSHDLRVPLQHIQVFVQSALDEAETAIPVDIRNNLRLACNSAERMDALITDLLAYSRISREEVEVQSIDLEFMIMEAVSNMRATIDARQAVIDVQGPMPSVTADRIGLQQVLRNLLSNAVKFVPKERKPHVKLRAEFVGGRTRLWVEDNGIGIDPKHHGEIFKMFRRVHSQGSFSGTGIGLSLVRKAMYKMGGSCGVESAPVGTRFWIEFPEMEPAPSGVSLGSTT
ncbi:MAG: PAS domain S-box protein [Opitutaceae bacterium]|nr:PAS domain S-box protein [Opitutaceae bacterium]